MAQCKTAVLCCIVSLFVFQAPAADVKPAESRRLHTYTLA